ncbi:hypothetical protein ACHWQZ_G000010 [Mnemiopsis leidyi]
MAQDMILKDLREGEKLEVDLSDGSTAVLWRIEINPVNYRYFKTGVTKRLKEVFPHPHLHHYLLIQVLLRVGMLISNSSESLNHQAQKFPQKTPPLILIFCICFSSYL